ncbi:hemolysin family protein [Pseudomonas sp. F1_0610]|uniref:hemolysin family protein n=1 Tax=Pseudomonas sp. F1_0610 TaxID=3114284 RepID=UPI0039C307D2
MDPDPGAASSFIADFGLLVAAIALILLNGFFVAAEFSLVKLRATHVKSLTEHSNWQKRILQKVHAQLDAYLSACQLGITLASLGLGWVSEPAFTFFIAPVLETMGITSPLIVQTTSIILAFLLVSYLHIVVGELAPKSWAIRSSYAVALWTAPPLFVFYWLMYPAIFLLNSSANTILHFMGQGKVNEADSSYSKEELKLILNARHHHDPTDESMRVMASVAEFNELEAIDWANSREDLIFLERDTSLIQALDIIRLHKYSRYPIFERETERFIGLLHIKDLLLAMAELKPNQSGQDLTLEDIMRPIDRVTPNTPLPEVLQSFRSGGAHFALVEEADGKAIGYLTMEDVLEIFVGDIQDEYRKANRALVTYKPGKLLVRGDTPLFKIERELHINLDHVEAETLAGLVYDTLGGVPEEEQSIETSGLHISIKKMKGPRILMAKVVLAETVEKD